MMGNVISNPNAIEQLRWRVILRGIKLEIDTGMKHSSNAPKNAARAILQSAGKHAPRRSVTLYDAFARHFAQTWGEAHNA
jgi:hypothetical protein